MTRAQEHVYEQAVEQKELATTEIKRLYTEFYRLKKEVTEPNHFNVFEGAMHTIGYWEGVRSWCNFVIDMISKSDSGFEYYLHEQRMVELHNEQMKKEMREMFKDIDRDQLDNEE